MECLLCNYIVHKRVLVDLAVGTFNLVDHDLKWGEIKHININITSKLSISELISNRFKEMLNKMINV